MRDLRLLGVVLGLENFVLRNGENQTVYQGTVADPLNYENVLFYPMFPYISKSIALFKCSQSLPVFPSDKNTINVKKSMKYWWNDTDRAKLQYLDVNLFQYYLQFLLSVTTSNSAIIFILPLSVIIIIIFQSTHLLQQTGFTTIPNT